MDGQWSGSSPDGSVVAADRIQNYNPAIAGATSTAIGLPHTGVTQYVAGCHGGNNANDGYDVGVTLAYTPPTAPYVVKMTWYERCDYALWQFILQNGEYNYKTVVLPNQGLNMYAANYVYWNFDPSGIGDNTTVSRGISTDSTANGMTGPERNGNGGSSGGFWGQMQSPFNQANGWVRKDWEVQIATTDPDGYTLFTDNYTTSPKPCVYASWTTDTTAVPTTRSVTIGGYSVQYPAPGHNYRYFADMMVDVSGPGAKRSAQVYLSTSPTYAQATAPGVPTVHTSGAVTVHQDLQGGPSSWTNTQITCNAWIAEIPLGTTVYTHVVCENGTIFQNTSGPLTVVAPPTFDFFISTTGSNSNAGTLASPWAITAINTKQSTYAGKRVGIIAGTYDVSSLMNATFHTPVLNINGGSVGTPTYIASCDTSGNYSARAATLDAKGASGIYGGGNSNLSSVIGQGHETNLGPNWGNWTIDGLRVVGFSMWGIHIGNYDSSGGAVPNVTIQNCELTGGSAQANTVSSGVNLAPIVNYTATNAVITNNWIHDNFGWTDANHFSGMYIWGLGTTGQTGLTLTYNTLANTGNIHSKEATQYNANVSYNYVDMTLKTPSGGSSQNAACIFGFNADGTHGTLTTIHHNVCIGNGGWINTDNDTGQNGWYTPVQIYNNTFVLSSNWNAGGAIGIRYFEMATGAKKLTAYNNLFANQGFTIGSSYGYVQMNIDAANILDYNCYIGSGLQFTTVPNGTQSSAGTVSYTTIAAWRTATGADAHSLAPGASSPFTNAGTYANQYTVTSGSVAFAAGKTGGLSTGAATNIGAWDGSGRPGASWVS